MLPSMAMTAKEEAKAVKDHAKWVYKIANEYRSKWYHVDVEDLIQEGMLGLLLAVRKWRPDGGASLLTYATYQIRARMRDLIGVDSSHKLVGDPDRPLSLDAPLSWTDDIALLDTIASPDPSPEDVFADIEMTERVRDAVHKLSCREQRILRLRFIEEKTLDEVAGLSGVDVKRSRVDQIEKGAVASLRLALSAA